MNNKKVIIWDLDGTLLDSYSVIVDSFSKTLAFYGLEISHDEILSFIKKFSAHEFIEKIAVEHNLSALELKRKYSSISEEQNNNLSLIVEAKLILDLLKEKGYLNYIYTHKGLSTFDVLKTTGIFNYFDEIITSHNGFKRKPHPEAIDYLIDKYSLDKANTYYIGDRTFDIQCAKNAGIQSILFDPLGEVPLDKINPTYIVDCLIKINEII